MDKDLKKLLDQLKQLGASTKEIERLQDRFNKAGGEVSKMNEVLESAKDRILGLQEAAAFAGESFASLTSILQANLTELSKSEEVQKRALRTRRAFRDVSKELLYDEEGINILSEKQLKNKLDKLEKGKTDLTQMAEELMFREGILQADEKISDLTDLSIKQQNERLGALKGLSEEERQLVMQSLEQFTLEEGIIKKTKARLAEEKRINKQMGLTGDLLKSAAGAMGKLGLDSKILGDALEDAQKSMRKLAEDANNSKLDVMMGALGPLAKGFGKALQDPLTILTFIGKSLLKASDTQAKFQKMTGMSATAAYGLKTEMAAVANLSGSNFITSEKLVKTYAMMTEQLGMAASAFSGDTLVDVTYMTEKLHLSAEAATQLATMSELNGKSSKQTNKELGKQLSTFNKQNKTMFSLKDLMNDIGTASKAMVLTLGKSPKALMAAAAEARKLGTNLGGVEKIAESLLDFESSIEKEMEAQLITGKQLNLSAAREAAMRGDMATVAKEVANQEAIREAFATNNVIAQQAAAEAIGLSREELAEMTYQQELLELGADKFKDKYGEVAYENLKAQGAQDKFNDAMTKMQSILGDVIGAFSPILDIFAKLMSFPLTPYIMAAVVASKALGGNFFNMFKGLDKIGPKLKEMGTNLLGMGGQAADAGKDIAGKTLSGAGDKLSKGGSGAMNMPEPKASGKKIREFFEGLAAGLKAMGSMEVVKGALALIPAAIGLTAMIPGAVGAKLVERVKGGKLAAGLMGMATGLRMMADGKVALGALALVAAGVGFTAMTVGAIGMAAVAFLGAPAASGLVALSFGLTAFGTAAMNPLTWAGIGLLTALGVALIPTAYAIGLVAPAIAAFGAIIQGALGGVATIITAISDGFVNLLGAISIEKAAAVGMMGLGLVGLAAGAFAMAAALPILPLAALGIYALGKSLGTLEGLDLTTSLGPLAELAKSAGGLILLGPALLGAAAGIIGMAAAATLMPIAAGGLLLLGGALYAFSKIPLEGLDKAAQSLGSIGKIAPGLLLLGPALIGLAIGSAALGAVSPLVVLAAGGLVILGGAISTLQNIPLEQIGTGLQSISSAIPGFLLLGPAMASAALGIVALGASAPLLPFAAMSIIGLAGALALAAPLMESAMPAFEGLTKFGEAIGEIGKGMLKMGIGVAALGAGAAMLAVFGPIAAIGVTAFAAGLAAAGILVIPAIPGLLAMAGAMYVLAPAMAMLAENGAGLLAASAGLLMLGPAFIGLAAGALVLTAALPVLAGAALGLTILAGGMAVMNQVDPAGLAASLQQFADIGPGLVVAGQGLIKMAGGMIAFSAAAGIMAMSSLAIWLALAPLGALAAMSTPLASTANSLTQIANALATIKEALTGIETEKLNELQGLIMTTAFAAPAVAAAGAITSLINGITGGGEEGGDDAVTQKLDEILQAIREGGDVYMDGNKVGESLMLSSVKSS